MMKGVFLAPAPLIEIYCPIVLQVYAQVERMKARGEPVVSVIIEAIQGEGGDNHATPYFFQKLQSICKEVWTRSIDVCNLWLKHKKWPSTNQFCLYQIE